MVLFKVITQPVNCAGLPAACSGIVAYLAHVASGKRALMELYHCQLDPVASNRGVRFAWLMGKVMESMEDVWAWLKVRSAILGAAQRHHPTESNYLLNPAPRCRSVCRHAAGVRSLGRNCRVGTRLTYRFASKDEAIGN